MKLFLAIAVFGATAAGGLFFALDSDRPLPAENHNLGGIVGIATSDEPNKVDFPRLPAKVDYWSQIEPVLVDQCRHCHSQAESNGGVRFDCVPNEWSVNSDKILLVHGEASRSLLATKLIALEVGTAEGVASPHAVSASELALISQWIDEGALWATPQPQTVSDWPESFTEHWSFRPLARPKKPASSGNANPIDQFIDAQLDKVGSQRLQRASTAALMRRLAFDVTGLPPTVTQLDRYSGESEQALDQFVDELLEDPAYGEHWAGYWLDLVRYADSNGYEQDAIKPLAWRYRDFVIRSLNEDRPFHQFARMQIAGDLVPQAQSEDYVAVGFLRLGPWDSEPDDRLKDRYDQLNEVVDTTSQVFLGLTLGCARCHDHPLEPLTCSDYARMTAVFHGLGRPRSGRIEETALSASSAQLTNARVARARVRELHRRASRASSETQAAEIRRKAADIESSHRFEKAYRFIATEAAGTATRRLHRGDPSLPLESVAAGLPAVLTREQLCSKLPPRLAFANWLIADNAPLTARLIVNRVWSWHFGRGLCETTGNLGPSGAQPTHHALLEWLSWWFVNEAGWSLKELHRLILTSETFRTRSVFASQQSLEDRKFYASFTRPRLRAEAVRDSMLFVSGQLSRRMYGKPDYVEIPPEKLQTLSEPSQWAKPTVARRRSIYLVAKRNLPIPFLSVFNLPTVATPCERRIASASSAQVLASWNSPLVDDCSDALAERVLDQFPTSREMQVQWMYRSVLGRPPLQEELDRIGEFLDSRPTERHQSLSLLARILFNLDEFLFLN